MADMIELLLSAFPDVDGEQIKNDVAALIDTLMSKNLLLDSSNQAKVS